MGYWYDPEPWNRLASFLNFPKGVNWLELSFIGIGAAVMSFLLFMRYHPLGYAMTTSWAPYTVWFSFFVGWLIKFMIFKYGGLKLYRRCRPFFLGVVFGEALIGGVWIIVSLFTKVGYLLGVPKYRLMIAKAVIIGDKRLLLRKVRFSKTIRSMRR